MERKRSFYERDTCDLITAITGLQAGDENFQLCLDFALSNFVSNQCVDEDWFKIKRKLDGLCEKYFLHTHFKKARKLQCLAKKYWEILDSQKVHHRVSGYAVVSVLIHLCGSVRDQADDVSSSEEEEELIEAGTSKEADDINWSEYLREDYNEFMKLSDDDGNDDSSVWDDSDDDDSLENSLQLSFPAPPPSTDSGIEVSPDGACPPFPPLEPFRPYQEPSTSKRCALLPKPYWEPQYQTTKLSSSSSCNGVRANFTKVWENHLAEQNPIYTPDTNAVLTEAMVLREMLWMLNGVKNTYLFTWKSDHFEVIRHVHLTHLTEETLRSLLMPFCSYGENMIALLDFIAEISLMDKSSPMHCQTYQAYTYGLQHFLDRYSSILTSYEEKITNQEETLTIIQLYNKLKPHLDQLEFLYNIHSQIMMVIPRNTSTFVQASMLLDCLFKVLVEYSIWLTEKSSLQMLFFLFLVTVRPYISMLESVVSRGQLADPYSEFFTVRNKKVLKDENFWDRVLSLLDLPAELPDNFFLKPCFHDVLLAGKSMEMLRCLDCYYEANHYTDNVPDFLCTQFVKEFQQLYGLLENACCDTECTTADENANLPNACSISKENCASDTNWNLPSTSKVSEKKYLAGKYAHYFEMLNHAKGKCFDFKMYLRLCQQTAELIQPRSLLLLGATVQEVLMPCIKKACSSATGMLITALKEKHHLMHHITVMKKYFLMECGDIMFSFYSEIFKKIFDGNFWQDQEEINTSLKNLVSLFDKKTSERLSLCLNNANKAVESQPLSQLSLLDLTYEVDWPINVVLSPEIQDGYCQIFCFLLQVKCAKYSLDELYCIPLQQTVNTYRTQQRWWDGNVEFSENQIIHAMYILRMKLLYFVNGFHSYIMTRILHSSGLELNEKLEEAQSLEDVLLSHRQYLTSLFARCLNDSKLPYLREQIWRILNLAMEFQAVWNVGVDNIRIENMKRIEQEFSSSLNFLTSYLKKTWKRGTSLHLETLASVILTDSHTLHVFS